MCAVPTSVPPPIDELQSSFRGQVARALKVELDGSEVSLAFVDHYLASAADDREPILLLLAAQAGAYYGELVRSTFGGYWVGVGQDPRRLRLLLRPQFLYFAPVDQALACLTLRNVQDDAEGAFDDLDTVFHLLPGPDSPPGAAPGGPSQQADAGWLEERMAELPPVARDHFHSLTCRFETLKLMVELLATKQQHDGRAPPTFELSDYLTALGEFD